jgi:hypothetical protein
VPLPPGTIEAFIGQGSLPIHGTHQGLAASDRVVATASATTEGVAANVMRLSKRPLNRTR